jgi:ABC-2 type transport system permease protein
MMGEQWRVCTGAMRYEFRMQVRRRAVWITIGVLALLFFALERRFWSVDQRLPLREVVGRWALWVNFLLPLPVGMLLADRLPRDGRIHVDEIFASLPAPLRSRLWVKYLGGVAAPIAPIFLIYCAGLAHIAIVRGDERALPLGLAAFVLVNVPGLLFVGAFSIACPAVLWVPLYQFLLVGYWFWGNFITPNLLPTLSGTWVAPVGRNASEGFFGIGFPSGSDSSFVLKSAADGVGSIATLLAMAVAAMLAAEWYLRWRQAHA